MASYLGCEVQRGIAGRHATQRLPKRQRDAVPLAKPLARAAPLLHLQLRLALQAVQRIDIKLASAVSSSKHAGRRARDVGCCPAPPLTHRSGCQVLIGPQTPQVGQVRRHGE